MPFVLIIAASLDTGIIGIDAGHVFPVRELEHFGGGDAADSPARIDRGEIAGTWHEHTSKRGGEEVRRFCTHGDS